MNRPNPFATTNFFKPASYYLSVSRSPSPSRGRSRPDEESDLEMDRLGVPMLDGGLSRASQYSQSSTSELKPKLTSLVSVSRSPSPYARAGVRSAAHSEDDEEEYEMTDAAQNRPLVVSHVGKGSSNSSKTQRFFQDGGLGHFFFATAAGWHVYFALIVFWVGGCQFGLLLMNRFILWTGTYKFPYPLTMTFIQLAITHLLVLGFASLTRGLRGLFQAVGLGAVVAPSQAYMRGSRATRYRGGTKYKPIWQNVSNWFVHGSGGIAGGGLFEFQWTTAKHVLPVAVVLVAKVVLSNLSFAYAVLPMYMLARIAIVPLSLLLTALLCRTSYSVATQSAALTAMLNLLMASIRPGSRVTWESIVAGAFSSLFVALYPIVLLRAYRHLLTDLVPEGALLSVVDEDNLGSGGGSGGAAQPSTKESTRAYWRVLHYTSLLSMALLAPLVLASGELQHIRRNCYFLDVPWFWFLMACGGVGSWAVFSSFLLLVQATSPLTATFVAVPRSAFQLAVLSKFRMPVHSWVGVSLCWASCLWYVWVRRSEVWGRERLRLLGR